MLISSSVILGAIGAALSSTAIIIGTTTITWGMILSATLQACFIFGGTAIFAATSKKSDFGASSPTYAGVKQTQTNQDLPLPLLYGTVKVAGNRIWQDEDNTVYVRRMIALAEGEIEEITDIRLNDIPTAEIGGISIGKYLGTQDQVVDQIVGGANQEERAAKVGSLKNLAYLAISVPRGPKIDMNYNLTAVVKGRKIRVYTNRNTYEVKYSENPAWVMFDFLTCYNGLGLCMGSSGIINDELLKEMFDIYSFIEAAEYCDELVNGKPRFAFNMIFDSQSSARDLIDEIYRACRGGLFVKNGKFQFKIDKPEAVSKVFTNQDIMKGSETFQTIPQEEHYDILKCSYVSPEHEWQKVEASAEIPVYRSGVPIEHSINLYSCTNFEQASRLAWYYCNSKRIQPYFGSFQTDYRAFDLEVGDVIKFDSLLMGLKSYKGKVTSVLDNGAGVYTINWRTYDERLYSDELGSKEPYILVSNLTDIASIPDDVQGFNVVQSQNIFNFVWVENQDHSESYEIRCGENWESANVIKKGLKENRFTMEVPSSGIFKFWIKAKNAYNYSKNPTLDMIGVDSIPSLNEIVKIDMLENMKGTFTDGLKTYQKTIKLKSDNTHWETKPDEIWRNDMPEVQTNGIWGGKTGSNGGVYESQIFDIGSVLESIVSFDMQKLTADESSNVIIKWSTSNDGIDFSELKITNLGAHTFRYCKFQITLSSPYNIQTILTKLTASIDVPDKSLELDLEIKNAEGLRIEYSFIKPPSIVATVNDNNDAYIVVTEKTNTYAVLKAVTNSGELTCCKFSLHARGY